ncbi:hypothetical protein BK648_03230 [Pseudomonas poae]|uniref:Fimbrial protein n=1 Tax=Pseudomonas poae TaxID=200451 RepID=A0A423FIN9_9PSED|nr:hypothetical protein [Pseudomonas poae]ROM57794.1 hypothetical protein BK648_03230 [Pseudomonas poae]
MKEMKYAWAIGALALMLPMTAHALTQEITALFRPDSSNPSDNKFVNTTPESGVCPIYMPQRCKDLGIFSIRTSGIQFNSNGPILGGHADPRKGATFKAPSEWRDVTVTHAGTLRSETLKMRISGIGSRYHLPPGLDRTVWARGSLGWLYAPAPCVGTGYTVGNDSTILWSWMVPVNIGACSNQAAKDIPSLYYPYFEYTYELNTPNPLTMDGGMYTGSLTYTIGPGGDFDFGDVMMPTDDLLTFNFNLQVQHLLKVEVPPGGNRVQLEPEGGWQAWLNNGRRPTRVFRNQSVNIWASTPFKMTLECGTPQGNTCSVRNTAGHQVPLDIAVTLPAGLSDSVGRPVNRLPLRLDGSGTQLFQPTRYIDRKPSILHFEINADGVSQMLEHGGGNTYSGVATVVWDSEV